MNIASQANETRDITFGIYDRLLDYHHCYADVVLAPAGEDGEPDWTKADPANVEKLPGDEWPDDEQSARAACVIVSDVDGCDPDATFLIRLNDDKPELIQIHGPESDRAVAESIIARDIGAEPVVRPRSALLTSMEKLAGSLAGKTYEQSDLDRLVPYAEAYGGEVRGNTLFGAAVDGKPCQIAFAATGQAWMYTNHGARPVDLPEKKAGKIKVIDPADWRDRPVPVREWYVPDVVPGRNVTLLSGDGGTGKSLLAYQIGIAGALGVETVGLAPTEGRVLYLAAEDDEDELMRRGHDILTALGHTFADLKDRMRVMPMAGEDAELMFINPERLLQVSHVAEKVEEIVQEFQPALLILDTSADVFGGDEINRRQVRTFVSMLRKMAMKHNLAILLLSHPSVAGMQTGTGLSGSTAWNNSVRSRLYLTADKDDEDLRLLKGLKSNYARKGGEMKLRWHEGAFILDDGKPSPGAALVNKLADKVFIKLLSTINRTGQHVSPSRSPSYAPSIMAKRPDREGTNKRALEEAMHRALAAGTVAVVTEGPPSRQRQRLVVVAVEVAQGRADSLPSNGAFQRPSNGVPTPTNGVCSHTPITPVPLEGTNGPLEDGPAPANDNIASSQNAACRGTPA
jgi:hypothetical protein